MMLQLILEIVYIFVLKLSSQLSDADADEREKFNILCPHQLMSVSVSLSLFCLYACHQQLADS